MIYFRFLIGIFENVNIYLRVFAPRHGVAGHKFSISEVTHDEEKVPVAPHDVFAAGVALLQGERGFPQLPQQRLLRWALEHFALVADQLVLTNFAKLCPHR